MASRVTGRTGRSGTAAGVGAQAPAGGTVASDLASDLAPDDPSRIRNVVLLGHSGSGRTTLVEALLAMTGTPARAGTAPDGPTVGDGDPAAVARQCPVALTVAPLVHAGVKVNLLDPPGHADDGALRAGLRAADAALFVVSAVDGIDAATVARWEECASVGLPRAVVVSRLDHARADFDESVAVCQRVFGDGVLPLHLPLHDEAGPGGAGHDQVAGLLGLISRQIVDHSGGGRHPAVRDADPEHLALVDDARNALLEGILAESEDGSLLDHYLAGDEIDPTVLVGDLETAVARGALFPVLPVAATLGVGVAELLELLIGAFPSPQQREVPPVTRPDGRPHDPLTADPAGPLVAEVVHTTIDPDVGRVALVRVFSGTLHPEQAVHVSGRTTGSSDSGSSDSGPSDSGGLRGHDVDERVGRLYSPPGAPLREVPWCVAGDLCVLTGVRSAQTGDTVSSPSDPLLLEMWETPEPLP